MAVKIIRDQVPVDDGGQELSPAHPWERLPLLVQKLQEEAQEVQAAFEAHQRGDVDIWDVVAELADVEEVLRALAETYPGGWETVERVRLRKLAERGGFVLGRRYMATP